MAEKKYQVFLSSTFVDLKRERQDAIGVILDLGHIPAGMEMFPAADVAQLDHIKRMIDQCDYYVLIMGARYGSTDEAGISFTEREYDYAVAQSKVVLAFPHATPEDLTRGADVDKVAGEKFRNFRDKVMKGRLVKVWDAPEELNSKVIIALHHAITDHPQAGWIRGDTAASEETLVRALKLQEENDELRRSIATLEAGQRPMVEGLAGLSEAVNIRYRYLDNGPHIRSISLTWEILFKVIGPVLMKPSGPPAIKAALHTRLNQLHGMRHDAVILADDLNMVRLHFIALGLVETRTANSVSAGVQEFLTLTSHGQARLIDLTAVRSA